MKLLKLRFDLLVIVLATLMLAAVSAKAVEDTFYVTIGANNEFIDGGGTGYDNGAWYLYPNTGWWNQWFYNGPYDLQRKKVIDLALTVKLRPGAKSGYLKIAYNWSRPAWSNDSAPPLPKDVPDSGTEDKYIGRTVFFQGQLMQFSTGGTSQGTISIRNHYEILDYNPTWLSIDVQGANFVISNGWIKHECVPKEGPPAPVGEFDFGDAPRPYPTLLANDGARHRPGGPWLGDAGDAPDTEADGQPNLMARGDDFGGGNNDEQGVSGLRLIRGASVNIYVDVNGGGGYVNAWIDFNRDGDWNDPGEQIYSGWLFNGHNPIPVTAPSSSIIGKTFARFRISSQGGLSPTGLAGDGEVEDHSVWIFPW